MSTPSPEYVPIVLPSDILAEWPWKRNIHPHFLQIKAESSAWINGFLQSTSLHVQRTFGIGDFGLLASLGYPLENDDVFRVGCDLTNFLFLLDLKTDPATPHEAQQLASITLDALHNPDKIRPADEDIVGEVSRQFSKLSSSRCCSGVAHHRLIKELEKFIASITQQSHDRAQNYTRSIDEYFFVRRDTIAARPLFSILQFKLNLPDEFLDHPLIQKLSDACVDLIILGNDLYSYDVERARGDDSHNLVTILMRHQNLSLIEAIKWIDNYCSNLMRNFLNDLSHVPSFGEQFQDDVKSYLNGLGNWVRAADCWSLESPMYFAAGGMEIKRNGKVVLTSET